MAASDKIASGAQRCALHDTKHEQGTDCPRCVAIRASGAIKVSYAEPNSVDLDAEILKDCEADVAYAKYLHRVSRERIEDGNPNDWRAAATLIAEGTKLKYRALEEKAKVSARAHSRYLVEHEKDVRGLRKKGN